MIFSAESISCMAEGNLCARAINATHWSLYVGTSGQLYLREWFIRKEKKEETLVIQNILFYSVIDKITYVCNNYGLWFKLMSADKHCGFSGLEKIALSYARLI